MDLRKERTKRSIINAFLQLRAAKPIEKITIKELSELAMINKATFYLHYEDIYALSEQVENDIVDKVFKSLPHPECILSDSGLCALELFRAFNDNRPIINIIFSGSRRSFLIDKIEEKTKKIVFDKHPELKDDIKTNVIITYRIKGGYYTFLENSKYGYERIAEIIGSETKNSSI